MPIPSPHKNESESDFMQRCMSDHNMIEEYPLEQRIAICKDAMINQKLSTNEGDKNKGRIQGRVRQKA